MTDDCQILLLDAILLSDRAVSIVFKIFEIAIRKCELGLLRVNFVVLNKALCGRNIDFAKRFYSQSTCFIIKSYNS